MSGHATLDVFKLAGRMNTQQPSRYHFPRRDGNHFHLRVDGDDFFPAMLAAIDQAENSVMLEMYLVASGQLLDQFIDKFLAAAERGVQVYLLFDDVGARDLNKRDRQRLHHPNLQLRFYNPLHLGHWRRVFFRDHRKLLLIDQRIAFVGGAGLTDDFDPELNHHYWRDLVVEINGPCVADWYQVYSDNWPQTLPDLAAPRSIRHTSDSQRGQVCVAQLSHQHEIKRSLLNQINKAQQRIWVTTPYFVPSWKIRRALNRAARRGVDVRLILAGPHTDHPAVRQAGQRFYHNLLRHGVRIFEYQPRFNHAKAYLCDQWCSIGSSNLDRWNMTWNLEGNQEVDDADFAKQLARQFDDDFEECEELQLDQWRQRPRHRRLLEWFWGWVDKLLSRLAHRGHRP